MTDKTTQLITMLAQESAPVKVVHSRALLGKWLAGFTIYTAILIAFTGVRPDFIASLSHPLFALELIILLALILTSVLAAYLLSFPDRQQHARRIWLPLPWILALCAIMTTEWITSPADTPVTGHGPECLSCISFYALFPGIWLFYNMRKLASTHAALAGMAAVTASFAMGAFALRLKEATDSIPHVALWHYLPMIGVAISGIWLGKQLLRW